MINWITASPRRDRDGLLMVVDGGATHSRVVIADTTGELLGFATGQPTNARSVGVEQAAANLSDTLRRAIAEGSGDPDDVVYGLVTSAAVDTDEQSENLSEAARSLLPNATVFSVPDTMGCWAATNRLGPAVAVISGTGSVVVAADRARRLWRRFGGWDFLLGDEGSGYSLGRAALQETLLVSEGRSGAEALSAAVLASKPAAAKHVTDAEDLPDAVHTPAIDKAWIASFAPLVLGLADSGDEHCLAIVRREIRILAGAAAAGIDALGGEGGASTPVGLFGGTFNSASLHAAFVDAVCELTARPFDAAVPAHTALVGAYAMALGADPSVSAAEIDAASDRLASSLSSRPGT